MSDKDDVTILKMRGLMMYPKLFHPDTMYEDKWTLDLLLDEDSKKKAEEQNLRVKHKDNYADQFDGYDGHFLRIERKVKNYNGEERDRPIVKDPTGSKDVPTDTGIGNGTEANVRFMVLTRDNTGKTMSPATAQKKYGGYGMFLTGVQIIELVPYERKTDPETDFVDESDGKEFDWAKGDEPFDDLTAAG
jgi:hypothetical protein